MYKYLIIAFFITITEVSAVERISVGDLLDRYQENQKNYTTYNATSVITAEINRGQDTYFSRKETEIFIDGDRIDFRNNQWPNLKSKDQATLMEDADNRSFMWDGSSFYNYVKQSKFEGSLNIKRNDDEKSAMLSTGYAGTPLIGIFKGDLELIGSILRQAKTISVQDQLEKIGETECYVINALTDHGEYTVWIDPEHGYNIAKAKVTKKKGDIIWGKPLGWMGDTSSVPPSSPAIMPLSGYSFNMLNVQFEQINDTWIPVEADYETTSDYAGRITIVKAHHKQINTDLHPDFKAMNAFVPDFPNGTRAYLDIASGINYIWQDGKLKPLIDEKFLKDLDNQIEQIEKTTKTEFQEKVETDIVITPYEQNIVEDVQPQKNILSKTGFHICIC